MTKQKVDIYRQTILDYFKHPRNKGKLEGADLVVTETNASCGDEIQLYLKMKGQVILRAQFEGGGCAISQAATSMLCEALEGMTIKQVSKLTLDDVYAMLGGPVNPGRVKCVSLGLKALEQAFSSLSSRT